MRSRDAGDRGELFEPRAFVVAAQCSFGKEVHGEQDAHQECKKREREFPK
jgi:hypothetical protein